MHATHRRCGVGVRPWGSMPKRDQGGAHSEREGDGCEPDRCREGRARQRVPRLARQLGWLRPAGGLTSQVQTAGGSLAGNEHSLIASILSARSGPAGSLCWAGTAERAEEADPRERGTAGSSVGMSSSSRMRRLQSMGCTVHTENLLPGFEGARSSDAHVTPWPWGARTGDATAMDPIFAVLNRSTASAMCSVLEAAPRPPRTTPTAVGVAASQSSAMPTASDARRLGTLLRSVR